MMMIVNGWMDVCAVGVWSVWLLWIDGRMDGCLGTPNFILTAWVVFVLHKFCFLFLFFSFFVSFIYGVRLGCLIRILLYIFFFSY